MAIKNTPTLKRQLLNLLLPSLFVLVATLGILLITLTSRSSNQQMLSNAQQLALSFSQQSVLALLTASAENADAVLQQMQAFPDLIGAGLWSNENTMLVWRGDDIHARQFRDNLANNPDQMFIWQNDQFIYLAAPVQVQSQAEHSESELSLDTAKMQNLGYALLVFSKERLQQQNRDLMMLSLLVLSVAVVGIFLFLSNWLQKIIQPLHQLSERMKSEDFLQQATEPVLAGSSEIQDISQSYQQMAAAIAERDEALKLHQQKLESLVQIRTRELTTARDAALTASRHKSEFLANISHELRTPLQSVIGYIDLVNEQLEFSDYADLTTDLNRAQQNAENLLKMINSLLDLAKIEAGKMELHCSFVRLNSVVTQAVELIRPLLQQNQLQLQLPEHSPELYLDGEKLLQILVNLLSNACKFTRGGIISLTVRYQETGCEFSIADTGIGMTEAELNKIFTPFYQADGSQSRQSGGTGLGLAITQQFVRLMNGKIQVSSKPGVGSEFVVYVPILKT